MNRSTDNVVDSKVVSLEFQNQNFEANAKTSLSTIERLKQALNFSRNIKGLDQIDNSVDLSKVNVNSLTSAVNTLHGTINNLGSIAAFGIIANEAIKAEEAVKRFIKSVTIDQVSAGWDKYAEKTSAVQTIMSATAQDFSDTEQQMEAVNAQLEKLNWFTDETSYSFLDMVSNIGKFTSNQIKLDDAVTAMEGISTWAAKSGANVGEASRAMYNLSQALATGAVKLMDWKSIENANMATAEFKQTVIDAAESVGTLTKSGDGLWKTLKGTEVDVTKFNASLSDGWFTSEVLMKSLNRYGEFTDKLHQSMEQVNSDFTTSEMLTLIEEYKDGSIDWQEAMSATGLTAEQLRSTLAELGDEHLDFGRKAFSAAQEAKTFEEAISSVKDAVSTGWMNTFEIMFGDYLGAKELWTDFANFLYEVFAESGNQRNELLKEAFNQTRIATRGDWEKLENSGLASTGFLKKLRANAAANGEAMNLMQSDMDWLNDSLDRGKISVDEFQAAFENLGSKESEVIKVNEDLKKAFEEAAEGEDMKKYLADVEELSKKYSKEDLMGIVFGDGSYKDDARDLEETLDGMLKTMGLGQEAGEDFKNVLMSMGYFTDETTKSITEMSREELRQLGYSGQQIKRIKELAAEGKDASAILEDLGIETLTGADHWINGLHNVMDSVLELIDVVKGQWGDVFPELEASSLRDALEGFDNVTGDILETIKTSENLKSAFRGVVAVVDLVISNIRMIGQGVGMAAIAKGITLVSGFAGAFISMAASLAKGAVIFNVLTGLAEGLGIDLGDTAGKVGTLTTKFVEWFKAADPINTALNGISAAARIGGSLIREWFDSFTKIDYIKSGIETFKTGFTKFFESVGTHATNVKGRIDAFIDKVRETGGIHIDNVGQVFSDFKTDVLDYIASFDGFEHLKTAFSTFWDSTKAELNKAGIDVSGFTGKFDKITGVVSTVTESVKTRFGKAFTTIGESVGDFAKGGVKRIQDFGKKVESFGGIKIDNVVDVFKMLKTDVLDYFANFTGFDALKDAFGGVWDDIVAKFSEFGIDLSGITSKFKVLGSIAKGAFKKIQTIGGNGFKVVSAFGLAFTSHFTKAFTTMSEKIQPFLDGGKVKIQDFIQKVKDIGGVNLSTIGNVFQMLKDTVIDIFTDFDGFKILEESFKGFWNSVKEYAASMDIDISWLTTGFEKMGSYAGNAFRFVKNGAMTAIRWLGNLWSTFRNSSVIQNAIDRFGKAFSTISESGGEFVQELWVQIKTFTSNLAENGGVTLSNIKSFGEMLWEQLGSFEGFQQIKEAVDGLFEDVKISFKGHGIDFDAIGKGISDLIDEIWQTISGLDWPESLDELPVFIDDLVRSVQDFTVPESFTNLFGTIEESKGTVEEVLVGIGAQPEVEKKVTIFDTVKMIVGKIVDLIKWCKKHLAVLLAGVVIFKLIRGIWGTISTVKDLIDEQINNVKASNFEKRGLGILAIAGAIALMVEAVNKMQNMSIDNPEGVKQAINNLTGIIGMLALLVVLIGAKFDIGMEGAQVKYKVAAAAIWGLAALVAAIGLSLGIILAEEALFDADGAKLDRVTGAIQTVITWLAGLTVVLGLFGPAISNTLVTAIPALATAIDQALPALGSIGLKLALVGAAIGILDAVLSYLTGGKYTVTGVIASGFEGIATIFETISEGVGRIIGALTGGFIAENLELISQSMDDIKAVLSGMTENTYPTLGDWLQFGGALAGLLAAETAIDWAGFINLLPNIASKFLLGKSNVEQFADDVKAMADGFKYWNDTAPKEVPVDVSGINALSGAIKTIRDSAPTITDVLLDKGRHLIDPEYVGRVEEWCNDLQKLANALILWNIKSIFIKHINIDEEGIAALSRALEGITKTGGLNGFIETFITGSPDFKEFGERMEALGTALQKFNTALGADVDTARLMSAARILDGLATIAASMSMMGESYTYLANFGLVLGDGSDGLSYYINQFVSSFESIEDLSKVSQSTANITWALTQFKNIEFDGDIMDSSVIETFKTNIDEVVKVIEGLVDLNTSGVDRLKGAVEDAANVSLTGNTEAATKEAAKQAEASSKQVGESSVKGVAEGASDASAVTGAMTGVMNAARDAAMGASGFWEAGQHIVQDIAGGISGATSVSAISNAITSLMSSATGSLDSYYSEFHGSGEFVGEGFAYGIYSQMLNVQAKARAIAEAAVNAIKDRIKQGSPSKITMESGNFFGEGFAIGIMAQLENVRSAANSIGESALDGLNSAVSAINSVLDSNLDTQPTIRPVLDLSEIQNGAGNVASLLTAMGPIDPFGSFGSIGTAVEMRRRAASLDDVVSALGSVRESTSNIKGGDTYNVNGVTYDDGSNITEAVRVLTHAVLTERRR